MAYVDLQVTSNFSFLDGGSHPEELLKQAAQLQRKAIAITDQNSFAGIVRAHVAAKEFGVRLIVGCKLQLQDGPPLLAYPMNKEGYASLCSLLTKGNLRTEKGKCLLFKEDVYAHAKDNRFVVVPPSTLTKDFDFAVSFKASLSEYKEAFGESLYLAATRHYAGDDQKQLYRLSELSTAFAVPLVATNNVYYHHPRRRFLQDVMTCIREHCTIYNAGYRLHPNAERYLKPEAEMLRLFRAYPDTILRTEEIAEACLFTLDSLSYEYPKETTSEGLTPHEQLTKHVWRCARKRYGEQVPEKIRANIEYELGLIREMNHAAYFVNVYEFVCAAKDLRILCQGRGSAANSTVCFVLGITSVNPEKFDLLFERFISTARKEPPDIDIDFEHERREEIIQYIYRKYGRDRAAIVATVTQQHFKGAVRDVGKAMGLSEDAIGKLAGSVWQSEIGLSDAQLKEQGFDPTDKHLQKVLALTKQYMGFPRQLGQHTGGFVITENKLSDLVPVHNARMKDRTCIEWNKDDIDALGIMKIDVLALGMLTCIRKSFDLLKEHYNIHHTLDTVPQDDPVVYDMISRADTIGLFQIESRAQQAMLPHIKPKCFYDLVIEVAIVRPGPIQGNMVHPYMRRRRGEEPVEYPSKELEEILKRTLGVPLFQEQAMKIAIVAAGFTPTEADQLRRSMATFKLKGMVSQFQEKITTGMLKNGYTLEYAQRVFKQLEGFGAYGFPESHAASFASLVYVSAWIKCYYSDVFGCAILNSLPMGFYQPSELVRDAREHGVNVRPVDVNLSEWDNTLEEKKEKYHALRLGFRHISGIRKRDAERLVLQRGEGYKSVGELRDAGLSKKFLEKLADADAFHSLNLDRRQALWEISQLDFSIALFKGNPSADENKIVLPQMTLPEHVVQDYASTGLSLKAHPVSFVRPKLEQLQVVIAKQVGNVVNGMPVKVAGLVMVLQRPETAKGVCFLTLQDESGYVNLVVFPNVFEANRKALLQARLLLVEGTLQREGEVVHVIAGVCYDVSKLLRRLDKTGSENTGSPQLFSDEKYVEKNSEREERRDENVFPQGRYFR